jgi:hypothetical protein
LSERASTVQADVIHGSNFAVYIGDTEGPVGAGHFFGLVIGGQVGCRKQFNKHNIQYPALAAKSPVGGRTAVFPGHD